MCGSVIKQGSVAKATRRKEEEIKLGKRGGEKRKKGENGTSIAAEEMLQEDAEEEEGK